MPEVAAVNPAGPASPAAAEGAAEEASAPEGAGPSGESIANASDPDAALEAEESGEEKPQAPKKKKLKLGDKEAEFDEDIAALIEEREQVYQKRKEHTRAANERFQQAAELFKKIDGIPDGVLDALRGLKDDPWALHKAIGADPDAVVAEYAKRRLAEAEMTPEQRQFEQQRQQLEARARQVQEQEQKIQQEHHAREVQRVQQEFAKNLPPVLEKFNLPDDEFTAGEIGKIIASQVRSGRQPDYEEAAEVQADRLESQLTRYLDRLSRNPGALRKKFPEIVKRLREEDVASVTAPRAVRPGKQVAPQPEAPSRDQQDEERLRARHPWAYGLPR